MKGLRVCPQAHNAKGLLHAGWAIPIIKKVDNPTIILEHKLLDEPMGTFNSR